MKTEFKSLWKKTLAIISIAVMGLSTLPLQVLAAPVLNASVSKFVLVDPVTDLELYQIVDGGYINLANLTNTGKVNIKAETTGPDAVGSVSFNLDTGFSVRTETSAPYSLFGDTAGNYFETNGLSLGGHNLVGTPYSGAAGAGVTGTILDIDFTVVNDLTKPTVSVVSPMANQPFNKGVPIAISAADTSGVASVSMNIYNTTTNALVSGCTTVPTIFDGTYWKALVNTGGSCNFTNDGIYKIKAWAYDNVKNVAYASQINFVIDRVKPTLSVTAPGLNQLFSGAVPISISAADVSGISKVSMHIYDGTASLVPGCTSVPTVFDGTYWNAAINNGGSCRLADGTYQIAAWAYDEAGNPGWALRTNFIVDSTPPLVDIDSPTASNVNGTIQIIGSVTDANPSHYYLVIKRPNGSVASKVDSDGIVYRNDSFASQLLWSFDTKTLIDGEYSIVLEARDLAGNKDSSSIKKRGIVVDNTAPIVPTLVSPLDGSFINGNSVVSDWSESTEIDTHHYVYESYNNASATSLRWSQVINAPVSQKSASNVANTTFWWRVKAVDVLGNTSGWSELWKVTVDNNGPIISEHEKITVEATSPAGTKVTYDLPTATDVVDVTVAVKCSPVSGTVFALGTTDVNCMATDTGGHTSTSLFQIAVVDTTSPVIALPEDITVEADVLGGKVVTYLASGTDIVDGTTVVTCLPLSESLFLVGVTKVTCTSTDATLNTSEGSFNIAVTDNSSPTIALTGITADITVGGVYTELGAIATDIVDGMFAATPSGTVDTSVAGSYVITYSATDIAGNIATPVTRTVNVLAAPVVLAPALASPVPVPTAEETPEVLGATTEEQKVAELFKASPEVKGSTDDSGEPSGSWNKFFAYKVMGVQTWIWLILLAAILGGWWILVFGRKRQAK